MHDLNDYFYFVAVVEKRGFTAAARDLEVPKSRLSRHVGQLEERLKVRLIQRTSRQFHITDAGQLFYQHARAMIDEMEKAEAAISRSQSSLSGRVTLSCSVGVAQFAIKDILLRFMADNPDIEVVEQVTNQSVDLIAQGIDLAIRGHNSPLPDSSLIQRQLAVVPWHLFAGPGYLEHHGTPTTPEELRDQKGLKVGWQSKAGQWSLENHQGVKISIPFTAQLCSDDMATLKAAAQQGLGIGSLPAYTCREEVATGELKRVLTDWTSGMAELSLIMPSRRGVAPAVRALADFLLAEIHTVVTVID